MKAYLLAAILALSALPAQAMSIITFSGAPRGSLFDEVLEDGFLYSTGSGALIANGATPSVRDMEGRGNQGGGVLKIVAADGGLFNFMILDYSAFDDTATGFQTLVIQGLRNGQVVASDIGTERNTNVAPTIGRNWTPLEALNLRDVAIDELRILLDASIDPNLRFLAVDDIYLSALPVPEPATWAMMLVGFGLAGVVVRRTAARRATA